MCARRMDIPWQEDAETLFRVDKQEPDSEIRSRLHALWLLRQGYTVAEVGYRKSTDGIGAVSRGERSG